MPKPEIVDNDAWLKARTALLEKEKAFTRSRDELTRERRKMPWRRVEKEYEFDGPDGRESLADLFAGRRQLIVYHFMFGPDWDEPCKSCSFLADHFDPAVVHLARRDVTMIAASRAPLEKLEATKARLGWSFKWVSAGDGDFNRDFGVWFTPEEIEQEDCRYNYRTGSFPSTDAPGASVFAKDENGAVHHTYSVYQRGLDMFIAAYHYLDIVPKGRDEDDLSYTMEWLRLNDSYE